MANPASALLNGGKKRKKPKKRKIGTSGLFFKDLEGNPTKPFQRSARLQEELDAEARRKRPVRRQIGGLGNPSPGIAGGAGLPAVKSPRAGMAQKQPPIFPVRGAETISIPGVSAQPSPMPLDQAAPPPRTGAETPDQLRIRQMSEALSEYQEFTGDTSSGPVNIPAIPVDPGSIHPNPAQPNIPPFEVQGVRGPRMAEQAVSPAQAALNAVYAANGLVAPKVSKSQEELYDKKRKKAESRRRELRGTNADRRGSVTIGGRVPGDEITIPASEVGTEQGVRMATLARERYGEATGTNRLRVGGKNYEVPAHIDPQAFSEHVTGYLEGTAGNLRQMPIDEAVKQSLDDFERTTGIPTKPVATIRKDGQELPIDFYLTQIDRERAAEQAERTGLPVPVKARGFAPGLLRKEQVPSAEAGKRRRAADKAAFKARVAAAVAAAGTGKRAKEVSRRAKEVSGFLSKSTNYTRYKSIIGFALDKWLGEIETTGSGDMGDPKIKRIRAGTGLSGASFSDLNEFKAGKPTVEKLDKLWMLMRRGFGGRGMPEGVLASAFERFAAEQQINPSLVHQFYRKHPEAFAFQLSREVTKEIVPHHGSSLAPGITMRSPTPQGRGLYGGGPSPSGAEYAGEVTAQEVSMVFEALKAGQQPTPEMEAIYFRMTERQKDELAASLRQE